VVATVVGWGTDAGAVRQLNEDAVSVGTKIFAVADGMGGHAAGDVASQMTVQALNELDTRELLRPADVVGALIGVSDTIARRAQAEPERWGMGTTVTGVALVTVGGSDHWGIFNVGDSRVYRFADGILTRATVDHSEVEELLTAGVISEEEARVHPDRNVITRSLGTVPAPRSISGCCRRCLVSAMSCARTDSSTRSRTLRSPPSWQPQHHPRRLSTS
jgi:serine/threonine protein phosphatase PrpC